MDRLLKKFGRVNLIVLVVLALLFPGIFDLVKIALLSGFILAILLLLILRGVQRQLFNQQIFLCLCFIVGLNLFFVLWGVLNGAESAAFIESLNIYVLYPLFYIFLIAALPPVISIRTLTVVLVVTSIITSYIVIAHVFRIEGVMLPGYELLFLMYPGLAEHIKTFAFSGETSFLPRVMERLIFFTPFSVVLVMVRKSVGLSRYFVWANLLLVVVAVLVSERRAMLLVLALSVVSVWVYWILVQPKRAVVAGLSGVGIVAIVAALFLWNPTEIDVGDSSLTRIGNSYFGRPLTIRSDQFDALMAATAKSPWLGVGFGNSVHGYARDPEHPWRFELTYVALFFQTGILGVSLYLVILVLLSVIVINSVKNSGDVILPYIFGLAMSLIAVATNPYLNYGTGQWILFLPLAVFNSVLLAKGRKVGIEHCLPKKARG
jgi:O-antigen ligase